MMCLSPVGSSLAQTLLRKSSEVFTMDRIRKQVEHLQGAGAEEKGMEVGGGFDFFQRSA